MKEQSRGKEGDETIAIFKQKYIMTFRSYRVQSVDSLPRGRWCRDIL